MTGSARALRAEGVAADEPRLATAVEALRFVDPLDAEQVYWAGRLSLCGDPDDTPRYDAMFDAWFRGRRKPRRLVLLLDVSGSMSPYADILLRFGHAAVRVAPAGTEVFTVSTRLTRITRQLRARDAELALAAAGTAIPDWSGGTRL